MKLLILTTAFFLSLAYQAFSQVTYDQLHKLYLEDRLNAENLEDLYQSDGDDWSALEEDQRTPIACDGKTVRVLPVTGKHSVWQMFSYQTGPLTWEKTVAVEQPCPAPTHTIVLRDDQIVGTFRATILDSDIVRAALALASSDCANNRESLVRKSLKNSEPICEDGPIGNDTRTVERGLCPNGYPDSYDQDACRAMTGDETLVLACEREVLRISATSDPNITPRKAVLDYYRLTTNPLERTCFYSAPSQIVQMRVTAFSRFRGKGCYRANPVCVSGD